MRTIALAGLVLALAACGGNKAADDANALTADNMMTDDNLMLDENAMNATGLDANATVNDSTANLMENDAKTHDADTNLANGI
jgi:hypothetical protein